MFKYFSKIIFTAFILISLNNFSEATPNSKEILERSIGELILVHNQLLSYEEGPMAFSIDYIYAEFHDIYQTEIKQLPLENRINFFWFAMWHLDFDGHVMMEFQKLVYMDCGKEFIKKLEGYIKTETKLNHFKGRLYFTKKVLTGMNLIKELKEKGYPIH